MGFCLIQYLFLEKNFQRKNLFMYVCGCMYVVLKGNGLCILSMMKQMSVLLMLQQFELLHLLRKFPVMFQAVPIITLSAFPLVLVSYKGAWPTLTQDHMVLQIYWHQKYFTDIETSRLSISELHLVKIKLCQQSSACQQDSPTSYTVLQIE